MWTPSSPWTILDIKQQLCYHYDLTNDQNVYCFKLRTRSCHKPIQGMYSIATAVNE